jgi:lipoprotein-releasing system permease protein
MRASGPQLGWRLLRGRKLTQWVAWLAALGVAVGTAAMLVVLAGFNGLEGMVRAAYEGIHAPYTLSPSQGQHAPVSVDRLKALPEVAGVATAVAQKALVRTDERELLVELWGVDSTFCALSPWTAALVRGDGDSLNGLDGLYVGRGVAEQLLVSFDMGPDPVELLWPQKGLDDVQQQRSSVRGTFSVHPQVDYAYGLLPESELRALNPLADSARVSYVFVWPNAADSDRDLRSQLQEAAPGWTAERPEEREKAMFQVLRSEGLATAAILGFIVLLASLGLYAAASLIILEKQGQRAMLAALGMPAERIRAAFMWSGIWLSLLGAAGGQLLGATVVLAQAQWGLLKLGEGYVVDAYPVRWDWGQSLAVWGLVAGLGALLSWLASRQAGSDTKLLRSA